MNSVRIVGCLCLVAMAAGLALGAETPSAQAPAKAERPTTIMLEALDPSFSALVGQEPKARLIKSGLKFTEGPTWLPGAQCFVFSDIPADTIYQWPEEGGVKEFRKPSHGANGNATDREGRLVTCEHSSRSITRTEKDGKVETIAATYMGKKLSSPNDVVAKSDGTVWFTDPPYGVPKGEAKEQDKNRVYRIDPGAKEPVSVVDDFNMPNGLCFSPDEKVLYIADSGKPHHIRRFKVKADNTLEGGEVFVTIQPGGPDGIRCDKDGRLWSSAGDGVHVFSPEGKLLGKIKTPDTPANLAFGGKDMKTLFITSRTTVWVVEVLVSGAK